VSQLARDTFCSYCGTRYDSVATYPRTCPGCKTQTWANPVPVCVALVPVLDDGRSGLLAIRRAIPPVGKIALVGGFLEDHETWQVGMAREVFEETGLQIDDKTLTQLHWASSSPKPNRLLMFAISNTLDSRNFAPFTPDTETAERGVIFGPGGIEEVCAFSLHVDAIRRYFGERGVTAPHGYVQR